jgi:hypothetical protein
MDKQARLDKALNKLGVDPATWSDHDQIRRTWQGVLTRGQDADLVQEASQGGGLGFPGAGKQTTMQTALSSLWLTRLACPTGWLPRVRPSSFVRVNGAMPTSARILKKQ